MIASIIHGILLGVIVLGSLTFYNFLPHSYLLAVRGVRAGK